MTLNNRRRMLTREVIEQFPDWKLFDAYDTNQHELGHILDDLCDLNYGSLTVSHARIMISEGIAIPAIIRYVALVDEEKVISKELKNRNYTG